MTLDLLPIPKVENDQNMVNFDFKSSPEIALKNKAQFTAYMRRMMTKSPAKSYQFAWQRVVISLSKKILL